MLETNVEANPLDRSHQDRITMLKQEISVIKETLSLQRNMFTTDHLGNGRLGASEVMTPRDEVGILNTRSKSRSYRYASNNSAGRSRLSPIEPNGVQSLLVQDSLVLLDKRIRDFKEIEERAIDLETWVYICTCLSNSSHSNADLNRLTRTSRKSTLIRTAKTPPSSFSPS